MFGEYIGRYRRSYPRLLRTRGAGDPHSVVLSLGCCLSAPGTASGSSTLPLLCAHVRSFPKVAFSEPSLPSSTSPPPFSRRSYNPPPFLCSLQLARLSNLSLSCINYQNNPRLLWRNSLTEVAILELDSERGYVSNIDLWPNFCVTWSQRWQVCKQTAVKLQKPRFFVSKTIGLRGASLSHLKCS